MYLKLSLVACIMGCGTAAPRALAQFSSDPGSQLQLANNMGGQSKISHNPLGGFYIAWQGPQGEGGNTYVQRLDEQGHELWAAGGVPVTDAQYTGSFESYGFTVDAQGNVLIAHRNNSSGSVVISLQKVGPDGVPLWGDNGVDVPGGPDGSTDSPHSPGVVCLSDGGYAVKFSRGVTGSAATGRACYQKVDANGNLLWNSGQAVVVAPPTNGYVPADMVASDDGSIIAFMYTSGAFTVSRRIHAQKFDASGTPLWNGGTPVVVQLTSTLQIGNFPQVLGDGAGGALVSWYETANPLQCFVQRLTADGSMVFPAGGATATAGVVAGQQRSSPHVAFDAPTQTTYMFYSETNTSQGASGIGAQAFDADGDRLWGDNGLEVVPIGATAHTTTFARTVVSDGGPIGMWFESTDSGFTHQVRAVKIDAETMSPAWDSPVTVNSMGGAKSRLEAVASSNGMVVTYGNAGTQVIASRINTDGSLGAPAAACATSDFDGDGAFGQDSDIEAFFLCLGGDCCATCWPGGSDFNGDGASGQDSDIESFFLVLGGGNCV